MQKHKLVADLKRLAHELGRAPTRDEYYTKGTGSYWAIRREFGNWSNALAAAGLLKAEKAEELFQADIIEVIKKYWKDREVIKPAIECFQNITPTAIITDTHMPFVNRNVIEAFYYFIKHTKPKRVIHTGDLHDMFSASKFPRSFNLYTPKQEMELAFAMAKEFWAKVQELVPGVECYQMLGNHDVRPMKRLMEANPAGEVFAEFHKWFQFPGVETIEDSRQELILDNVMFFHGYRSGLGDHRDYVLRNSVVGHTHRGGVTNRAVRGETLWELNSGYAGDPNSKALSYTTQRITVWTPGFGSLDQFGPRFIPVAG